jgi:arylsulfatase A-like enzyme
MIKWPGKIKGGQMISEPAMSIDLLPTFVEAAGGTIKPEEEIDGVSLLGRAEGKEDDSLSGRTLYWKFLKQWAIRRGEWKLVVGKQSVHKTGEASWVLGGPDSDKPQLFNLKSDVAEQKDVSQEHPEIVKELTESYKKWEGRHGEWGHGEPGKY